MFLWQRAMTKDCGLFSCVVCYNGSVGFGEGKRCGEEGKEGGWSEEEDRERQTRQPQVPGLQVKERKSLLDLLCINVPVAH